MDKSDIIKYINLCKKSNSIIYGIDAIKVCKRKIFLVLTDINAGSSLKKSALFLKENGVEVLEVENLDSLLQTQNCKAAGFLNENLASVIKSKF